MNNILDIFGNEIETEQIYEIKDVKSKLKELKIHSIDSIEKIILWSNGSIDIKTTESEMGYGIVLKNKNDTEVINKILKKNLKSEEDLKKIKDKR